MVLMTDEWCDTSCPLCGSPLNGEALFHMSCAREEQARADMADDTDDGSFNAWEL